MNNNIAILEIYPNKILKNISKKIDAHLRNALRIKKILDCDLLLDEVNYKKALEKKFDCFILAYASRYAPFRAIAKLINKNSNAKKIVLSNEYNINSSIGLFSPYYLISNYENLRHKKNVLDHFFINLNVLIFNENVIDIQKKYDCIYYGTYRTNRENYFVKYLQESIYLSTSSKNYKKFKHIGCNPCFISKINWESGKETLRLFKYSLYIEDEYTHKNYNCLANRFYEAVMCRTVLFFDINCKNTVIRSGYDVDEFFFVSDYNELCTKIKNSDYNNLYTLQSKFFYQCTKEKEIEEKKLLDTVKKIVEN